MTIKGEKPRLVSIEVACRRLETEIERLGGAYPLLSTNVETRMDGTPRADRPAADVGVCVYFSIKKTPYALACDTFDSVAQNIAALVNHIEATRRIASYGVASAAETLQAFAALPPPGPAAMIWWQELGLAGADALDGLPKATARVAITDMYKALAKKAHPDNGGSPDAMARLNAAKAEALKLFGEPA